MKRRTESVLCLIPLFNTSSPSYHQQKKQFKLAFYPKDGAISGLVFRFSFSQTPAFPMNGSQDLLIIHYCSLRALRSRNSTSHFNSKLSFAIRKGVEELFLEFKLITAKFRLQDYIFKHAFFVKLHMLNCTIVPHGSVSWLRLKELNIDYSTLSDAAFQSVLIGCPLLEWLQLTDCFGFSQLKIASKTLKRLVLLFHEDLVLEIEISCPNLEELRLLGWSEDMSVHFKDVSSLSCASLDYDACQSVKSLVQNLLQLQHVKELTFGNTLIETLARLANKGFEGIPLLKNKSLTFDNPDFGRHPSGIAYALRISPELEKLVIKDLVYEAADLSTKYWDSKGSALNSIVSCLKTVHIVGLRKSKESKVPIDFVDFLLNNSPVMEKFVMLKDH